jgi:hypothetical protein
MTEISPAARRSRRLRVLCAGVALLLPARAPAQAGATQPPVVTSFSINGGADSVSASAPVVTLGYAVVGTQPSEYRVAHRADFEGVRWLPYTSTLQLRDWYDRTGDACDTSRSSHRVTLYFQVRSTIGEELRIVDGQRRLMPAHVESNVVRATICAHT